MQFSGEVMRQFGVDLKAVGIDVANISHDDLEDQLQKALLTRYEEKEKLFGPEMMRWLERRIVLDVVDNQWKDHLLTLDHLKEGINLRGYGQKDPLVEFKKEAFTLFEDMMERINSETIRYLFLVQPAKAEEQAKEIERKQQRASRICSSRLARHRPKPPSPSARARKLGATIPALAAAARNIKSATAPARSRSAVKTPITSAKTP